MLIQHFWTVWGYLQITLQKIKGAAHKNGDVDGKCNVRIKVQRFKNAHDVLIHQKCYIDVTLNFLCWE